MATPVVQDRATALTVLNASGMIGDGYVPLTPAFFVGTGAQQDPVLYSLLQGAVGISPNIELASPSADLMWDNWPTTTENWSELLAIPPVSLEARSARQPSGTRAAISPFAHVSWDAAIFGAKAMASALRNDRCMTPNGTTLDLHCTLREIRGTTHRGSTGRISLDAAGDRLGIYGVVYLNAQGEFISIGREDVLDNGTHRVLVDTSAIVWSDGKTGRAVAPNWGQSEPLPTDPPQSDASDDRDSESNFSLTGTIVIAVLGGVLVVFLAVVAAARYDAKRRKLRPADFRQVRRVLAFDHVDLPFTSFSLVGLCSQYSAVLTGGRGVHSSLRRCKRKSAQARHRPARVC